MDDLEQALIDAWERVRPQLLDDPDELHARLARRRLKVLRRPPRAWCLSVRAGDTRITAWDAELVPESAMDADDPDHPGERLTHDVTLDKRLMTRLAAPVRIAPGGEDAVVVAGKLGVRPPTLYKAWAMAKGKDRFMVRHEPRWAGKTNVPILYSEHWFDPCSGLREPSDPVWRAMWRSCGGFAGRLPDGFRQVVTREPDYRAGRRANGFPGATFRRWRWVCPGCGRRVLQLFCPVPVPNVIGFYGLPGVRAVDEQGATRGASDAAQCESGECESGDLAAGLAPRLGDTNDVDEIPGALTTFACRHCHRPLHFSSVDAGSWNVLVTYLSGGLLYGREVDRPASLPKTPKNRKTPRDYPMGPSRQRVLRGLLDGKTDKDIAIEMGISPLVVAQHAHRLYRKYGVHSRYELQAEFGRPTAVLLSRELPVRARRERVAAGLRGRKTQRAIAEELGLGERTVSKDAKVIYRVLGVNGRAALRAVAWPPRGWGDGGV